MTASIAAPLAVRLIANPTAGGAGDGQPMLNEAAGLLAAHGWTVSVRWTSGPGDARALARAAADEAIDVVVAAGGDGTVNEVVNGIVHSATALGVLPMGTGNVLAAQLGLVGVPTPFYRPDVMAAAEALTTSRLLTVDTGYARPLTGAGRYFLLWAGIGFDAAVALAMEGEGREFKRRFGPVAYGAVGLRAILGTIGTPAVVRTDERHVRDRLMMAVIANIPLYAGAVALSPAAQMDDGILDVELFLGNDLKSALNHIGAVLTQRRDPQPERVSTQAAHVRVAARKPLPVHLDAEPFGTTPMRFVVQPASLRLLVPLSAPESLFQLPQGDSA